MRDHVPGFTGVVSDLGGPSANMYRLNCRDPKAEASCRRQSCLFPDVCKNMDTDQSKAIDLYRRVRELPGIKKIVISTYRAGTAQLHDETRNGYIQQVCRAFRNVYP